MRLRIHKIINIPGDDGAENGRRRGKLRKGENYHHTRHQHERSDKKMTQEYEEAKFHLTNGISVVKLSGVKTESHWRRMWITTLALGAAYMGGTVAATHKHRTRFWVPRLRLGVWVRSRQRNGVNVGKAKTWFLNIFCNERPSWLHNDEHVELQ